MRLGTLLLVAGSSQLASPLNLKRLLAPRIRNLTPFFDDIASRELSGNRRNRIYANKTKISQLSGTVRHDDLITPPQDAFKLTADTVWITAPFRCSILLAAYGAFPLIIESIRGALPESAPSDLTPVLSGFAPAISLLYGAWLGLTFNILEQRIGLLQRTAIKESAMLASLCERTVMLLNDLLARQCLIPLMEVLFEQTTMLAERSREDELLLIANDDPYWRYRRSLKELELQSHISKSGNFSATDVSACHETVDQLVQIRAERLSMETKSLPAAHFSILAIFSIQLWSCFTYSIAQSPAHSDDWPLRVAFSFFTAVYILVFNFAVDLNDPFRGNYQVRRSAINANIIAARRIVAAAVGEDLAVQWRDRSGT